ncbi:MAG TPA: VanW family protein [Anaerolineae bacterium]|nr:VanW family protein [Anaerolineae bacterium]
MDKRKVNSPPASVSATRPAARVPAPPAAQPARRSRLSWELTIALLLVALLVAAAATFAIMQIWLADRILPGVQVWDVDVSGLTRAEAAERLQADLRFPADRYPIIRYGDQFWRTTPDDLSLRLDAAATAAAAFTVGHEGGLGRRLSDEIEVLLKGRLITPAFWDDPTAGSVLLNRIAAEVDRPLRNATIQVDDALQVVVTAGQSGRAVDQEASRQAVMRRVAEMTGGEVLLVVRESEPLLADMSAAQAEAQRILSAPVTLTAPGYSAWAVEPKILAGWLVLQPLKDEQDKATLHATVDQAQIQALAEQMAAQMALAPVNAQFRWSDAAGGLEAVVESAEGQQLDIAETVRLIVQAASSEERTVALPVRSIRPSLASEDAPSLGITALLAEGTTSFAGSAADRIQNIIIGTAQFDGLLIPPGETFSFNHYLGEVTTEKGYVEGIIIWGDTTRADVGGGLCQVASTAFRAAFWAGVPITERTAHAFRVSYYEPPLGMDATIYSPSVDLKWVNDTGHHILVHTWVDQSAQTVTFRFYGTNPGRTIELDGPYESNPVPHGEPVYRDDPTLPKGQKKQIEWAKDGLDVTVYRIIKQDGAEVGRDTFFSRYRPWQAVYLVGTKE